MDDVEGLWTAEFGSSNGWTRGGIAVLAKGRFLGGGEQYYIEGRYGVHGGILEGNARCSHFHGPVANIFGDTTPDFHVTFKGRVLTDLVEGHLYRPDQPGLTLPFRLARRASLA